MTHVEIIPMIIAIAVGYVSGSISFAQLVARNSSNGERAKIRDHGAGASTIYRALGPRAAYVVLLGDFGKSAAAVALTLQLMSVQAAMVAAAAVVVGHSWPIFYGFKGGRGAAAAAGGLLPLVPTAMGIGLLLGLVVFLITRNMVITCLALFAVVLVLAWALRQPPAMVVFTAALPAAVAARTLVARRRVPLRERWRMTIMRW